MDNKYYEGYRRFTFDWAYEDQEKYSEYESALEDLESKEIISDEEYNNTISRLEASNDYEELERYRHDYVSESDYHFTRESLLDDMKFLQTMYRVTEEQLAEDKRIRAMYSRDRLRLIKNTYDARNMPNIMRDVEVDSLSDDEVIEMFRNVRHGLSADEVRELGNEAIRRRVSRFDTMGRTFGDDGTNGSGTSGNNDSENGTDSNNSGTDEEIDERNEIERRIAKFNDDTTKIREHLEQIKGSIVLGAEEDLAVDAIRQLDSEVRVLDEFSQELITKIDNFRDRYANADFSVGYKEITAELQSIKNDLRTVKQLQIENYNYTVDATNQVIESLRSYDNPEINAVLDSLPTLNRCNANITRWDARMDYLDSMDYNALIEVNRRLSELQNMQLGVTGNGEQTQGDEHGDDTSNTGNTGGDDDPVTDEEKTVVNDLSNDSTWTMVMWELHNRMNDIEARLADIKAGIVDDMTLEDVNRLRSDLTKLNNVLIDFNARLDVYKNEIGEEAYNELFERYELAYDDLYELNTTLNEKGSVLAEENGKVFNDLKKRLEFLTHEKDYLNLTVNSLVSKANEATVEELLKNVNNLVNRLGEIERDAKEALDAGKIDNNQYEQLMKNIETLKPGLEEINELLREPNMIKNADIYSILNGDIDDVERAIDELYAEVESLEKPIKRPERKMLDQKFKAIEKEINRLEKILEQYRDKDPEKYEATAKRLQDAKARLDKVGKKYRSKCPLLVRGVKSAVNFFKKHKKICLIIAGLAAFALVAHHVLIPAIMHGNIMIASTTPALRGFAKFTNNVLGPIIGATKSADGLWMLGNGVIINPVAGSSSLLKGLATCGISSAALIAPQIIAVKKLMEKMQRAELKNKLTEGMTKAKEKMSSKKEKKPSTKRADKMSVEELARLLKEYRKSRKTLDEFCEENGLSEDDKTMLQILESRSKENLETLNNSGRKGR